MFLSTTDPRRHLGQHRNLLAIPALHLNVSIRQLRSAAAAAWVDHVLAGDAPAAAALARRDGAIPFHLTRSLAELRAWLRGTGRGLRRAGLLCSSGARRLRAEGLGVELPHMGRVGCGALVSWTNFPPDIRASDALELVANEFSCQGLELDHVGLCWDGDLVRVPGQIAWRARRFRGMRWQHPAGRRGYFQSRQYLSGAADTGTL